jgi:putative sterol carrier protein
VVLKIDDDQWTLDLRKGTKGSLQRGVPADKPDLTLTVSDDNFAKLVMGKMNPQQVSAQQLPCHELPPKPCLAHHAAALPSGPACALGAPASCFASCIHCPSTESCVMTLSYLGTAPQSLRSLWTQSVRPTLSLPTAPRTTTACTADDTQPCTPQPHNPTSSTPHPPHPTPLQAFLLRKLKIAGSMGMAMKLPAVLEAAQPKSKM